MGKAVSCLWFGFGFFGWLGFFPPFVLCSSPNSQVKIKPSRVKLSKYTYINFAWCIMANTVCSRLQSSAFREDVCDSAAADIPLGY